MRRPALRVAFLADNRDVIRAELREVERGIAGTNVVQIHVLDTVEHELGFAR